MTGQVVSTSTQTVVVDETSGIVLQVAPTTETVITTSGAQGPQGIQGPAGPQGPIGPQGPVGIDLHYVHQQAIPSDTWVITHGMNKYPAIVVVDSSGSTVEGEVEYLSSTQLQVVFAAGFSGTAYLN